MLEKQEDILYEEHDKFINVQKSLALETKKNELLCSEISACNDSISNLKNLNVDLNARIEKLNVASSSVEHVSICAKCKDIVGFFCFSNLWLPKQEILVCVSNTLL